MSHMECARCGQGITGMGRRMTDLPGSRYVHAFRCPPPPEREPEPVPTRPYLIVSRIRPFCRQDEHIRCSGVTVTAERIAQVCACECHRQAYAGSEQA